MTTPIILPTSPETRAKLEKAGFLPHALRPALEIWTWQQGDVWWRIYIPEHHQPFFCLPHPAAANLPIHVALEFASILGIQAPSPPGMRMVPEEVAASAIPFLAEAIERLQRPAVTVNDCAVDEKRARHKLAYLALVAALSPKEAEK